MPSQNFQLVSLHRDQELLPLYVHINGPVLLGAALKSTPGEARSAQTQIPGHVLTLSVQLRGHWNGQPFTPNCVCCMQMPAPTGPSPHSPLL